MTEQEQLRSFLAYYDGTRSRLQKAQKAYNREIRRESNPLIRNFSRDLADMNEGGKLLRGMLIDLGYRMAGGADDHRCDDLAIAFEMFQTAVLIHDDIIDSAEMRRGKLTIHRRYEHRLDVRGISRAAGGDSPAAVARSAALCTGDMGLYLANKKLAEAYREEPVLADLILYFDRVIIDTIRGELLDVVLPYELMDEVYSEEERRKLLEKSVYDIYRLKTACYSVVGPLHLGMMLAGAPEEQLKAADSFAADIGIAYQIMDDILGIYADADVLGKDVGSDIAEFKQTILWMYVRTRESGEAEKLLKYYGHKNVTEENLEKVRDIFRETGALSYAQDTMHTCYRRAHRKLARMKWLSEENRTLLKGFMIYLSGRRK